MAKLHSHLAVLFFILFVFFRSPVFSRIIEENFKTSFLDVSNPKISQLENQEELRQNGDSFISRKLNSVNQETDAVPVILGTAQNSNYLARLGIGTPAKQLNVTVDTGTGFTWIKCLTDSEFDPTESSSYKLASEFDIPDELPFTSCINGKCSYEIKYADESSSSGSLATETFTLGSSVIDDVFFGCGKDNQGDTLAGTDGILGLGVGPASFPSQMKAKSFSYCLVARESGSSSTLSFGSSIPSDAITIPFTERNSYYTLSLTGISVGSSSTFFSVSDQEFTSKTPLDMDSGAFITLLPTRTYNAIRDEFVKSIHSAEPSNSVHSQLDTCFNIPSGATVPRVAFHFGDTILELPKENYLLPDPKDQNVACFAFAPTEESSGVLGNFQQQGFQVTFDLMNSYVGFSANKC